MTVVMLDGFLIVCPMKTSKASKALRPKKSNCLQLKSSLYLPKGWTCQDKKIGASETTARKIWLKTDAGKRFNYYKAAAAYMEEDSKYNKEDVEKLYQYPEGKNHQLQSKEEMQMSKYLPKGWLFREKKRGLDILTSDGTKLESYVAVNRYMLFKQSFTKKEMDLVYLFPDGMNHKTGQN